MRKIIGQLAGRQRFLWLAALKSMKSLLFGYQAKRLNWSAEWSKLTHSHPD
jgi:hypothetical protein